MPAEAPDAQVPWRWRYPAVGYVAAAIGSTVCLSIWTALGGSPESIGAIVVGSLGMWVGYVGAPLWAARDARMPLTSLFPIRAKVRDVLLGGVAGVVIQLVVVPVASLPLRWLAPDADVSAAAADVVGRANGMRIALLFVVVAVGAPIAEELFFRGLLQRIACNRFGPAAGITLTSLIFATTHFQPLQFLGLAATGACFGLIAWRTGRLGPAIAAHAAFNATTVITLTLM